MPLSELTELVDTIDGIDLTSSEGRSAIVQRISQLQTMLKRVGASDSAAQLSVAALLLQRTGDEEASADEDAKRMVRMLLVAVEQSFHLQRVNPAAGAPGDRARDRAPESTSLREPHESRAATKSRAAELAVIKDMLLGEVLIHFDVLAPEEISAALELQRDTDQGLGDILVENGFTTRDEIQRALDYQNRLRSMIADGSKAESPSEPTAEQPQPILPTSSRALGRLRLATELLLGEMLVVQGTITREGLERALELQRSSGILIGEALIQTGGANWAAIQQALVCQGRGDRIGRGRSA